MTSETDQLRQQLHAGTITTEGLMRFHELRMAEVRRAEPQTYRVLILNLITDQHRIVEVQADCLEGARADALKQQFRADRSWRKAEVVSAWVRKGGAA